MRRIFYSGLLAVVVTGCPTVERDAPITESAAIVAVFAPDAANPCNSDLPFPTDLAKDPVTGRLVVPFCETDDAATLGLKSGLRTLDGYALNVSITVRFSGEIDPATAADAVTIATPTGETVEFSTAFLAAQNNLLVIQPSAPLQEQTRYLVVVDNTVRGADGREVVADQVMTFTKSTTPLIDAKGYSVVVGVTDAQANGLEPLRQAYEPIWTSAEAVTGKDRAELVSAFVFTTQTGFSALQGLAAFVASRGSVRVTQETSIRAADHLLVAAAGIPVDNVCAIHTGRAEVLNLLTDGGTFGVGADGMPVSSTIAVDYMLATPKGNSACDTVEPWDLSRVAVFSHALGRCKNDAIAIANAFAAAGYATLSVDAPRSGTRSLGALGDQNLDGCPDSPATPELIFAGTESTNPFGVRDRLRQWALELNQITSYVRARPYEFAGQTPPGTPVDTRVVLAGHSWGGMAALLAAPLGGAVQAVAVNAVAGELGTVFAPLVQATFAAAMPGATPEQIVAASQVAVTSFRWALEPADPLFSTAGYSSSLPVLLQVVSAGSESVALHAKADQQRLGAVFEAAGGRQSTFLLADSEDGATFCSDAAASLSSLLQPCNAPNASPVDQMRAGGAYLAMQRQMVTFLATATSTGAVVCDPNITVACP